MEEEPSFKLPKELWEMVQVVKAILSSMGDGELTSSPYDTAWVAMVPDLCGSGSPQFPSCVQWIIDNQLDDGSWGDQAFFFAHDRIINTLACSIVLRIWMVHLDQCKRGLLFLKENIWRLAEEDKYMMPVGFEMALPSLIDIAKDLGMDFPYHSPVLESIYVKKENKLKRIPMELIHKVPTPLLHSLEGMQGLDWEKLLKLQSLDGSFLFSPSSTAFALMQTRDENCHEYLEKIVNRFHGGVPNVYPVDLFEHLWAVDRLQRLGISRYFNDEIKLCMEYVFKFWNEDGICWARNSKVRDIDDTAMGFRLLRLHEYNVSPDVFEKFKSNDEFFGFLGQLDQAVTGTYNLNRASQLVFSGEEILDQAKAFSSQFLRKKQASNQLLDKWVISKDLSGEVAYTLDFPFYASLPRIEARWYLDQYGGGDDVWIGKTLYRMLYVNNAVYLELAKTDFNECQAIHQLEWLGFQRWYKQCDLYQNGMHQKDILISFFSAAASIFEPDRTAERLSWARTSMLAEFIASSYHAADEANIHKRIIMLPNYQQHKRSEWKLAIEGSIDNILELFDLPTIMSDEVCSAKLPDQVFRHHLLQAWEEWLLKLQGREIPERCGLMQGETALLLVRTIELCAGRTYPGCEVARVEYDNLAKLTVSICGRLQAYASNPDQGVKMSIAEDNDINKEMKELIERVLERGKSPNALSSETKQNFWAVVRSFYYLAWCPITTLHDHISKVLFEKAE